METSNESPKKKSKAGWIVGGIALLILLGGIGYAAYEDYMYPKSQDVVEKLLLNKYWRVQEGTLKEVYIDGRKVNEPGSNVKQTIQDAVGGNPDGEIYSLLKERLKETYAKENFIWIAKMKKGGLFQFEMTHDQTVDALTYTTYQPQLKFKSESSRFALVYPDGNSISSLMSTGELADDGESTEIKNYQVQVAKITEKVLVLKLDITIVAGGRNIRLLLEYDCKPYDPPSSFIKRVEGELGLAEWSLDDEW